MFFYPQIVQKMMDFLSECGIIFKTTVSFHIKQELYLENFVS